MRVRPTISRLRYRRIIGTAGAVIVAAATAAQAGALPNRDAGSSSSASPALAGAQWSTNLLLADRSSFNHSTGGWVGNQYTTARRVPYPHQAGAGSLAIVNSSRQHGVAYVATGLDPANRLQAVPGARYALNFWVLASANAGRGVAGEIAFLDANGHEFERAVGQKNVDTFQAWTRVTDTVAIAPANAKYVVARVNVYGVVPTETHFVDTVTLTRANGGSANVVGPLHTAGNQIVDGAGRPAHLRGFVRVGMQTGPVAPTVTA